MLMSIIDVTMKTYDVAVKTYDVAVTDKIILKRYLQ